MYAIFNDQSINNMLTNNIVCFEQLDPDFLQDKYGWNHNLLQFFIWPFNINNLFLSIIFFIA